MPDSILEAGRDSLLLTPGELSVLVCLYGCSPLLPFPLATLDVSQATDVCQGLVQKKLLSRQDNAWRVPDPVRRMLRVMDSPESLIHLHSLLGDVLLYRSDSMYLLLQALHGEAFRLLPAQTVDEPWHMLEAFVWNSEGHASCHASICDREERFRLTEQWPLLLDDLRDRLCASEIPIMEGDI